MLVTKQPHAISLVQLGAQTVSSTLPLNAEPSAATEFLHAGSLLESFAVADVEGNLHLFETEMEQLVLTHTLELPEPFDLVDPVGQWGMPETTQLLGLSRASATIWRLHQPFGQGGMPEPWALPAEVVAWEIDPFSDVGAPRLLMFSESPSAAALHSGFGIDRPSWSSDLDHTPHATDWGPSPWAFASFYALSIDAARITKLGDSSGEATSFSTPQAWVDTPLDTVDFIAIGGGGFVCASTSAGLAQIPLQ